MSSGGSEGRRAHLLLRNLCLSATMLGLSVSPMNIQAWNEVNQPLNRSLQLQLSVGRRIPHRLFHDHPY